MTLRAITWAGALFLATSGQAYSQDTQPAGAFTYLEGSMTQGDAGVTALPSGRLQSSPFMLHVTDSTNFMSRMSVENDQDMFSHLALFGEALTEFREATSQTNGRTRLDSNDDGYSFVLQMITDPAMLQAGSEMQIEMAVESHDPEVVLGWAIGVMQGGYFMPYSAEDAAQVATALAAAQAQQAEQEQTQFVVTVDSTGRLIVIDASTVTRSFAQQSVVARDQALGFTRFTGPEGEIEVVASHMNAPGLVGGLYTWVELSGFHSFGSTQEVSGHGLQFGADIELGAQQLLGLSFGYRDVSAQSTGFAQEGSFTFVQPYYSFRQGAFSGSASLLYGEGEYTQTAAGGTGEGDLRLSSISLEGGRDIALGDGVTLTPTLGLTYGEVETTGRSGTLAGTGTTDSQFTQSSIGARLSRAVAWGTVTGGLFIDHVDRSTNNVAVNGLINDDGISGRVEIGLEGMIGNRTGVNTSLEISGIGQDMQQARGGVRFSLSF